MKYRGTSAVDRDSSHVDYPAEYDVSYTNTSAFGPEMFILRYGVKPAASLRSGKLPMEQANLLIC